MSDRKPDVSVKLVLRVGDKVLILRHQNGRYHFPGGKLEWGETPEEALKRELVEELNYTIPARPRFVHLYNYLAPDKSEHMVLLHYLLVTNDVPSLATTQDGPNAEPDSEVLWLTRNELATIISNPAFINQVFAERGMNDA